MTMKIKNLVLIGFAACALLVCLGIKNSGFIKWTTPQAVLDQPKVSVPSTATQLDPPIGAESTTQSTPIAPSLTAKEQPIFADWEFKRGYTTLSGSDYIGYSEEALTKLANEGDINALVSLGNLYYSKQGMFEAAEPYLTEAAMRGSTLALQVLAMYNESSNLWGAQNETDKRNALLRSLVWCEIAALRGDRWPQLTDGRRLLRISNITLTEENKQYISTQAHEIYNKLEEKRLELGLGKFDNSVPPEVNAYFDSFERYQDAYPGPILL